MGAQAQFNPRARFADEPVTAYEIPMRTRVRELRRARGWSQAELAHRSGVRQATISKVETDPEAIEITTYIKLAAGLECELADIFDDPASPGLRRIIRNFLRLPRNDREMITRQVEAVADRLDEPEA